MERSKNPIVVLSVRLNVRIPKMASLMPVEALELVNEGEGKQVENKLLSSMYFM